MLVQSTYIVMGVGLIAAVQGNRNFGQEISNIYREAPSGISVEAYYIGKCLADLPLIVVYSFIFSISFYTVAAPSANFRDYFALLFLFEFALFAVGYICSLKLATENALLLSTMASLLAGLANGDTSVIDKFAWSTWYGEGYFNAEVRMDLYSPPVQVVISDYVSSSRGFDVNALAKDMLVLLLFGAVFRILGFKILYEEIKKREKN